MLTPPQKAPLPPRPRLPPPLSTPSITNRQLIPSVSNEFPSTKHLTQSQVQLTPPPLEAPAPPATDDLTPILSEAIIPPPPPLPTESLVETIVTAITEVASNINIEKSTVTNTEKAIKKHNPSYENPLARQSLLDSIRNSSFKLKPVNKEERKQSVTQFTDIFSQINAVIEARRRFIGINELKYLISVITN